MKKIAYFDGAVRNNPSHLGGYGFVIEQPTWVGKAGEIKSDDIDNDLVTNNIAEYYALAELLKELDNLGYENVTIYGDSQLVVKIVNKEWGYYKGRWNPHKKAPHLTRYAERCFDLVDRHDHNLKWIPREQNNIADNFSKMYINERK